MVALNQMFLFSSNSLTERSRHGTNIRYGQANMPVCGTAFGTDLRELAAYETTDRPSDF